jgi:DNA-binding NtrC family response regulator
MNKKQKKEFPILIAEDNKSMRQGIRDSLVKEGYPVETVANGKQALQQIRSKSFNLVITDLKMPQMDGRVLFQNIRKISPHIYVIFITAYATVDIAVEALKGGAYDFITKPFPINELRQKVESLYQRWRAGKYDFSDKDLESLLIGQSSSIRQVKSLIEKAAKVDSPVLITGESGTGKELVARSIYEKGSRSKGSFIAVNCGALNDNLLESELFGHEKGAFTGAVKAHTGKFEQAHAGVLFLDEIGEMSSALQVKVLRVLQNKQFHRVGGEQVIESDFRLISATNRDLEKEVENNNFRPDLFYRLNVIPIFVPPLRDRKKDIPLLLNYFMQKKADELKREVPEIDAGVMRKLQSYSWPGNVRELENFIERALVFIEGDKFDDNLFSFGKLKEKEGAGNHYPATTDDLVQTLEKMEREIIINTLRNTRGVKQQAARQLNIKPSTLYYRMDKLDIKEEDYLTGDDV